MRGGAGGAVAGDGVEQRRVGLESPRAEQRAGGVQQGDGGDREARFFVEFAGQGGFRSLAGLDRAAGEFEHGAVHHRLGRHQGAPGAHQHAVDPQVLRPGRAVHPGVQAPAPGRG